MSGEIPPITSTKPKAMQQLFWKMAGADCAILEKSGAESQQRFRVIGMLFISVICCMLVAFCGLFWNVFGSFAIALPSSFIVTFLVACIYRLNMLSLEPPTLRDQDERKTKIITQVVRYCSIALFAFFTAKCMEGLLFGVLADQDVLEEMQHRFGPVGGNLFVEHIIQLNLHHPWVWSLTAGMVLLFLLPIILKFRLRKRKEYFSIKKAIEIRMVLTNHERYKSRLDQLHRAAYADYKEDKKMSVAPHYTSHESKYSDEPFNTQRRSDEAIGRPSKDFVNLNAWK